MMEEQKQTKDKKLSWAKLYLVPQNDNHAMPPYVVGILTQETAGAYVLMKMLEETETEEGWDITTSENMNFINRTYVWRVEMLREPPQLEGFGTEYSGEGGLG